MASADFSRFVITACLEARPRDLSSYGRILSILCLPHLLQSFRIAIGLQCSLPPYPRPKALYVVPVRQARCLPPASFRFYLAIDTLASGWTLPAIRARWGFAPVRIRSCWTNKEKHPQISGCFHFDRYGYTDLSVVVCLADIGLGDHTTVHFSLLHFSLP